MVIQEGPPKDNALIGTTLKALVARATCLRVNVVVAQTLMSTMDVAGNRY